jgi:hypothetical protein
LLLLLLWFIVHFWKVLREFWWYRMSESRSSEEAGVMKMWSWVWWFYCYSLEIFGEWNEVIWDGAPRKLWREARDCWGWPRWNGCFWCCWCYCPCVIVIGSEFAWSELVSGDMRCLLWILNRDFIPFVL